jgi:hypothetical protein
MAEKLRDTPSALVRAALAPKRGDPDAVRAKCRLCKRTYLRRKYEYKPTCPACSHRTEVEALDQISAKQGPAWEKTVRGQLRYWLAEAARLGIDLQEGGDAR